MRTDKEKVLDAYLAAAARTGDRRALGRLAQRWQPKLLAHAHRLSGETQLAADVAQDAWMDILRGIGRLEDEAAFAAWAFRIVSRRCARAIRRRQRARAGTDAFARETESNPTETLDPADGSDLAVVRRAMQEIPREQRAALGLFYLEGLRVAEIAVALDVAPGTVKTRLMHARNKLRARLEGEEMSKIDDLINETLSEEDEALLENYSVEPGYFRQAMALFRGKLGWVMWFVGIIQLVFFLAAIYALLQVFGGRELIDTLRWGVVTVILVQLSTFLRGFMGAHFEANRVLRAVKRLELRLRIGR